MGRIEEIEGGLWPIGPSTLRVTLTALASVTLAALALWEFGVGLPVAAWLYAAVAILFAVALVRQAPIRRQIGGLSTLSVLCAVMAALYFVDWTSRKSFLRDLDHVRPGMTEAEARQIMAPYAEGTGWPAIYGAPSNAPGTLRVAGTGASYAAGRSAAGELTLHDSLVFRHATNGDFDSDWGIVTFTNGRVVGVSFSPD